MRKALFAILPACGFLAAIADGEAVTETEIWNEGVDCYRSGDTTNALEKLRPLMLSRKYGARASEIVGAISYAAATSPAEAEKGDALKSLEEAAAAAQIALRAAPDSERARRNFSRAVKDLPELKRTRHINSVRESAKNKNPEAILLAARNTARDMMESAAGCKTNSAAAAIALADSLQLRAEKLADDWLAAGEAIAQAVTNEEQAATIADQLEQARTRTLTAAKALGDLSDDAYGLTAQTEEDFNNFFKLTVLPNTAMNEDLVAQSNAWQDVENFNNRSWQNEALDYTRAFRMKFPAWAQAYEQSAQADTNKPPFTAEAQAKISALSTELEKTQLVCVEKELPPDQERALELIREIIELLPKDKSSGGQASDNSQQKQNDNSDQDKNKNSEDKNQNDGESDERQDESQQKQDEQQEEEKPADLAKEDENEENADEKEIEAILKKAQERTDEHEAEKKARMRKVPLPPNERDW